MFLIPIIIASSLLFVAVPIGLAIALASPQKETRLAPEENIFLKWFILAAALAIGGLFLTGVLCMSQALFG